MLVVILFSRATAMDTIKELAARTKGTTGVAPTSKRAKPVPLGSFALPPCKGQRFWDRDTQEEVRLYTVEDVQARFSNCHFNKYSADGNRPISDFPLTSKDGSLYDCWAYDGHVQVEKCECPLKDIAQYDLWEFTEQFHVSFFANARVCGKCGNKELGKAYLDRGGWFEYGMGGRCDKC